MVDPAELNRMRAPGRVPGRSGRVRRETCDKLATRMVAGDEAGAWGIVETALAWGVAPPALYLELLVPALRTVGDAWAAGDWSVADEHRATVVAQRIVGRLGPRFARRGRKRGTVVLGAPAGELHGLPSAILGDLLRGTGLEVMDVGANTPAESFVETARQSTRLVAVMIGATTPGRDPALRAAIRSVRRSGLTVPILAGGAAVSSSDHARRLGADAWSGTNGQSALAAVDAAVSAIPNTRERRVD
jgi:methanogenic corrinoid protein MtbC1